MTAVRQRVPLSSYTTLGLGGPARRFVTAGTDTTIRLWRAEDGEPLGTFLGHTGSVWRVVFSPDGRLGSLAYDGTARVEGTTAIPVSRLTALRIESPTRRLLLRISV